MRMSDPFGWYANRFAAGIAIAAATGLLLSFVVMIIQLSTSDGDHNPFLLIFDALFIAVMFGPLCGGVLGGLFAFLILISLLKRVNPWQAFVPLTLGASVGLGIEEFVTAEFLPNAIWLGQSMLGLVLLIAAPAFGGIAAGAILMMRQRERGPS